MNFITSNKSKAAAAVALALAINGLMFIGIPFLSAATAEKPGELYKSFVSFNVSKPDIEKKKERPEKHREEKKPEKLPTMNIQHTPQQMNKPQLDTPLPDMKFELNASLAEGMAVSLPSEAIGVSSPGLRTEFDIGEVDTPPQAVFRASPIYPFSAKRRQVTGDVVVRFLVDENGKVSNISIVSSEPAGVFDEAAVNAVKRWKFRPGIYDGKPVRTWVTAPFEFRI